MPEILIASLSPLGHIGPLLNVAQGLVDRGDRVTVLTSAQHAAKIRAVGATPRAIPAEADFDVTRLDIDLPGRADTSGIKRVNFDIVRLFVQPMPHQARVLAELMAGTRFDAVIVDAGFFGILPFLLGDRDARPPVLAYTTTPLMVTSRDTAPSGMGLPPSSSMLGRVRNRALTVLSQKVLLRQSQNAANYLLDRLNSRRLPMFILDSGLLADRYISPTVPEFDYPRSDLPSHVRYVGAVHQPPSQGFRLPPWWSALDGDRPVVHVTQGTNVAEHIPHDLLLPKVDVMVTNGGYGAVQRALSTGVPLVVAGNTEDKPEVAARVAWTGAGINLRTGTPTSSAVRAAVREVLNDGRYLRNARKLEAAFARRNGVAEIAALVDEVISEHATVVRR
jgi:UDP:flavonoid glycosyltransferase YjiC (YdhE family)